VIVQDATILGEVDVASGLRENGTILVNTEKPLSSIHAGKNAKTLVVPASRVAQEILGRPIANTALLGAFAAATGELTVEAASQAVKERLGGQLGEKNALVVQRSYEMLRGGE
jgi:pyruvate ferredoxin oxidoreductase gamma subunit